MRYKYKVRELKDTDDKDIADVGSSEEMEAMSFKKLRAKLDHKKKYFVEYRNKRNNFVSTVCVGVFRELCIRQRLRRSNRIRTRD